jgi:hypothetical protein
MEFAQDQAHVSADYKRNRTSTGKDPSRADYDSYQLHLDDEMRPSQAWRYDQVLDLQETLPQRPEIALEIESEAKQPMMVMIIVPNS